MFFCLGACVADDAHVEDLPAVNPQPAWAWPRKSGDATRVTSLFGLRRDVGVQLRLEYDLLKWYARPADGESPALLGAVQLRRACVHGDVARSRGQPRPVLDVEAGADAGGARLVLEFESLEVMHEWWCALSTALHLARKLSHRRGGRAAGDWDDDEFDDDAPPRREGLARPHETRVVDVSHASGVRRAYEQVLRMVIRPPRARYALARLGPPRFDYGGGAVRRDDFAVTNARGLRVEVSLWRDARRPRAPVLVYLHGNASCRLEGLSALTLCLSVGASLCAIDCSGSGLSGGDYVSLGHFEADDVVAVVDHLREQLGIDRYGLWGRSMGAVTALLYAAEKSPTAACIVADSPFASLDRLARDLVRRASRSVPSAAVSMALRQVRASVRYRAAFDVFSVDAASKVVSCASPALFVHGADDDFIQPQHSEDILAAYGGATKLLLRPRGNHNAQRPPETFAAIEAFLREHLMSGAPPDAARPSLGGARFPGVPNAYLVPPWAYRSGDPRRGVDACYLAAAKKAAAAGDGGTAAHSPLDQARDGDFVSGATAARQREVEAGVGALFGAGARK
ncbi:Alpha/Beta hydrolase protein [Pelagophyceae sp. CCMP2097]|nr:Alpha/Beta hydrolase protein [Pelagophyceae sp. CCMP2097]|mmetsp:Transcript_31650/g.106590  ORF Transcript_31650/g.106590 Transcript_31650/m.106590 type:complete len:569 (+) Transcript_31650:229-1935(+)